MRTFVSAKIHGIKCTDKSINYNGSVSICPILMKQANIKEYEQVHIINLNNGNRWVTYALKAKNHEFTLNGGGAHLGNINDKFVILAYKLSKKMKPARVIFCAKNNKIKKKIIYK